MFRAVFIVNGMLGLASAAQAGVVVTLVPRSTGPYDLNNPANLTFNVDVYARLEEPVAPPAPGSPGARLRLAQFDLSASSPELTITPVITHTGIGEKEPLGTIEFWDFSSTANCTNNPPDCGQGYFIDDSLTDSSPNILKITYALQSVGLRFLTITTTEKRIGVLQVELPQVFGSYILDVVNSEASGEAGAQFSYGFGSLNDPIVKYEASAGEVLGGRITFTIPEPATLALLALGGLAVGLRRRHEPGVTRGRSVI